MSQAEGPAPARRMEPLAFVVVEPMGTARRKTETENGDLPGETFGRRLAHLRKRAGFTQREFAPEIGVSQRMLAYYEAQTDHPPAHLLPAIAKALGVSTDHLLGLAPITTKRPPVSQRLLRKLRKIEELPPRDQKVVLRTIDALARDANGRG